MILYKYINNQAYLSESMCANKLTAYLSMDEL